MDIQVKLGDATYAAPQLNVGQLRRYVRMLDDFTKLPSPDQMALFDHNFAVAKLCFERLDPAIADLDALEASIAEIAIAKDAILQNSGVRIFAPGEALAAGAA